MTQTTNKWDCSPDFDSNNRYRLEHGYLEPSERKSIARLIAAAPETAAERDRLQQINGELLAMLERVFKVMPEALEENGQLLEGEIAALINKARGQSC